MSQELIARFQCGHVKHESQVSKHSAVHYAIPPVCVLKEARHETLEWAPKCLPR
jgi:hypothetical protein